MVYKTSGVCSSAISFDIDDAGKVHDVKFQGGCSGNTQGVAKLIEGMDAKEAISRLEGIRCGFRPTSCPDQLSKALKQAFALHIEEVPVTPPLIYYVYKIVLCIRYHLCPIYHTATGCLSQSGRGLCSECPRSCG